MYQKKILIDLDGVLNNYGDMKYDENVIPNIKEGADEFLKVLSKMGKLYLFTSRKLLLTAKWLIENNLDRYFEDITNVKLPSFLLIDDRAVCFKGDFNRALKEIKNFEVYWK